MALEVKHNLLIVQGFGDHRPANRVFYESVATTLRNIHGIATEVYSPGWHRNRPFTDILDDLGEKVIEIPGEVSLLGTGGGGTLAVLGLIENPTTHKAVAVSTRFRSKNEFATITRGSDPQSILADAEELLAAFNSERITEERIMTIRPRAGDPGLTPETSQLMGARNAVYEYHARGTYPHMDGVKEILTTGMQTIVNFLKN